MKVVIARDPTIGAGIPQWRERHGDLVNLALSHAPGECDLGCRDSVHCGNPKVTSRDGHVDDTGRVEEHAPVLAVESTLRLIRNGRVSAPIDHAESGRRRSPRAVEPCCDTQCCHGRTPLPAEHGNQLHGAARTRDPLELHDLVVIGFAKVDPSTIRTPRRCEWKPFRGR